MTWYYVDSSVAVHALFGTPRAAGWLEQVDADPQAQVVSSRLLRTELTRVLRREGLPVSDRDRLLVGVSLIPVTDAILTAAEGIVPHVKTLDAIHLASAMALGGDPVVVTHDATMTSVARDLALQTLDPLD